MFSTINPLTTKMLSHFSNFSCHKCDMKKTFMFRIQLLVEDIVYICNLSNMVQKKKRLSI